MGTNRNDLSRKLGQSIWATLANWTPSLPSRDVGSSACVFGFQMAIYRWPFEKDGHSVLIDVDGPVTLDQATLARSAVLSSIGLTLAMQSDVRADIEAGRLEQVLEDWAPVMAPLCLYYQVGVTRPQPSRRSSTLPVGWVVRAPAEWPAADIDL